MLSMLSHKMQPSRKHQSQLFMQTDCISFHRRCYLRRQNNQYRLHLTLELFYIHGIVVKSSKNTLVKFRLPPCACINRYLSICSSLIARRPFHAEFSVDYSQISLMTPPPIHSNISTMYIITHEARGWHGGTVFPPSSAIFPSLVRP